MEGFLNTLDFISVYFTILLLRSAVLIMPVLAVILLLRRTVLRGRVFVCEALWSMVIPVLFIGRLRLFYESELPVRAMIWIQSMAVSIIWVPRVYMSVVILSILISVFRRIRLTHRVKKLSTETVCGMSVHISDEKHTPFTTGLFHGHIVIPRIILGECSDYEIRTIIEHERTHIRLKHLWIFFLWDIVRCLLWINPLIHLVTRQFREDIEAVCDYSTIKRTDNEANSYGKVLTHSLRLIGDNPRESGYPAAFARTLSFNRMKQRILIVRAYKDYSIKKVLTIGAVTVVLLSAMFVGIVSVSYEKNIPIPGGSIYSEDKAGIILSDNDGSVILGHSEGRIHIDGRKLLEQCPGIKEMKGVIGVSEGGYMKLPGVGGESGEFGWLDPAEIVPDIFEIESVNEETIYDRILWGL